MIFPFHLTGALVMFYLLSLPLMLFLPFRVQVLVVVVKPLSLPDPTLSCALSLAVLIRVQVMIVVVKPLSLPGPTLSRSLSLSLPISLSPDCCCQPLSVVAFWRALSLSPSLSTYRCPISLQMPDWGWWLFETFEFEHFWAFVNNFDNTLWQALQPWSTFV